MRPSTISVCVCTFRRPHLLKRCLAALTAQDVDCAYSIVVADNDARETGRAVAEECGAASRVRVIYCVEPEQNIAMARNRAVANADGQFIAFLDDDELAPPRWLGTLVKACEDFRADGVLGPVKPLFDQRPPAWLVRGGFCERPQHKTGTVLRWEQTRTGNVLLRRAALSGMTGPFRREFVNGGEDNDFFRRSMERGRRFVWCDEAAVFEVVPPDRQTRRYFLRRALLRGQNQEHSLTTRSVVKSLVAVPLYGMSLPFALVAGHHRFMDSSIRLADHVGKLLASTGIRPLGNKYLAG